MSYNRKHEDKRKKSDKYDNEQLKRGEPYKRVSRNNNDWKSSYEVYQ